MVFGLIVISEKLPKKLSEAISNLGEEDRGMIERAYKYALLMHRGQKRRSGSPYILHPVRVALRAAKDKYDAETIAAGLLHDVIEDTHATMADLEKQFSPEIAQIVDGVTKISALRTKSKALAVSPDGMFLNEADNYRKILLAGLSDIRVMILRIFDRLDNVATMKYIAKNKRQFYARETIEIYAPIAERLGMGIAKGDLEDLAFPYAYPTEYAAFAKVARKAYKNPQKTISRTIPEIIQVLEHEQIKFLLVEGRAKRFFSLYKKMLRGKTLESINDIAAVRVIVPSVADCYRVLGFVHQLYRPIPGKIKDYIARPKDNGYQSLHTTVTNETGNTFEIQIRTLGMHHINEFGYAAHWDYKDSHTEKNVKLTMKNRREWLGELEKIQETSSNRDFIKQLKEKLFSNQVFVFTPKGKIIKLPKGACGLDFAYQIHTQLGNTCSGVKINGKLMPFSTELQNGDTVEILSTKKASPREDWLKIAKTSFARHQIKNYLRQNSLELFAQLGEKSVDEFVNAHKLPPVDKNKANAALALSKIPLNNIRSAFAAIAEGKLSLVKLIKVIYPKLTFAQKSRRSIRPVEQSSVSSLKGIRHAFAGCCKPKQNDVGLIGYLGRDHVIRVHKQSCQRLKGVDEKRLIEL